MINLKDVAKLAGVSVSTASYAMNGRPEVNKDTLKKVLDAAASLNYKPSGIARDLKMKKTETIGLVLSNLAGPFYAEIINGIEEISFSNGYNLIVCSSFGGKNSTALKFLSEQRTDGIIIMSSEIEDDVIVRAAGSNFPIVLLDRELKNDYTWSVTVDNKKGAYSAVEHLIKLGCKRIGNICGPSISLDNKQRFEGYREALKDYNLEYSPKLVLQGQFTRQGGYRAVQSLIAGGDMPEALFCSNDEMAIGAIEALNEINIKIPDQLAIVGFDDIELASYISPKLTTIKHPKYLLGNAATHMLIQALNMDFNIKNVKLDTQLIIRESCGFNLKRRERN